MLDQRNRTCDANERDSDCCHERIVTARRRWVWNEVSHAIRPAKMILQRSIWNRFKVSRGLNFVSSRLSPSNALRRNAVVWLYSND